jgi:hypothetical protein
MNTRDRSGANVVVHEANVMEPKYPITHVLTAYHFHISVLVGYFTMLPDATPYSVEW